MEFMGPSLGACLTSKAMQGVFPRVSPKSWDKNRPELSIR